MGAWDVDWGAQLAHWAPTLVSVLALPLCGAAAWKRPPKWLRLACGVLGGGLLLWAMWYFVFRPIF